MSNSNNFDVWYQAVDQSEGISRRENVTPTSVSARRPASRRLHYGADGVVYREQKAAGCERAALGVPIPRKLGIQNCLRMPSRLTQSHGRVVP